MGIVPYPSTWGCKPVVELGSRRSRPPAVSPNSCQSKSSYRQGGRRRTGPRLVCTRAPGSSGQSRCDVLAKRPSTRDRCTRLTSHKTNPMRSCTARELCGKDGDNEHPIDDRGEEPEVQVRLRECTQRSFIDVRLRCQNVRDDRRRPLRS